MSVKEYSSPILDAEIYLGRQAQQLHKTQYYAGYAQKRTSDDIYIGGEVSSMLSHPDFRQAARYALNKDVINQIEIKVTHDERVFVRNAGSQENFVEVTGIKNVSSEVQSIANKTERAFHLMQQRLAPPSSSPPRSMQERTVTEGFPRSTQREEELERKLLEVEKQLEELKQTRELERETEQLRHSRKHAATLLRSNFPNTPRSEENTQQHLVLGLRQANDRVEKLEETLNLQAEDYQKQLKEYQEALVVSFVLNIALLAANAQSEKTNHELLEQIDKLNKDLEVYKLTLNDYAKENTQLQEALEEKDKQLNEMQKSWGKVCKTLFTEKELLEKAKAESDKLIEQACKKLGNTNLLDGINAFSKTMLEENEALAELELKGESQEEKIAQLQTYLLFSVILNHAFLNELTKFEKENEQISQNLNQFKQIIHMAVKKSQILKLELEKLQNLLNADSPEQLIQKIILLKQDNKIFKENYQSYKKAYEELVPVVQEQGEKISNLEQSLKQSKEKVTRAEKATKILSSRLNHANQVREKLAKELESAQKELRLAKNALGKEELTEGIQKQQGEIKSLEEQKEFQAQQLELQQQQSEKTRLELESKLEKLRPQTQLLEEHQTLIYKMQEAVKTTRHPSESLFETVERLTTSIREFQERALKETSKRLDVEKEVNSLISELKKEKLETQRLLQVTLEKEGLELKLSEKERKIKEQEKVLDKLQRAVESDKIEHESLLETIQRFSEAAKENKKLQEAIKDYEVQVKQLTEERDTFKNQTQEIEYSLQSQLQKAKETNTLQERKIEELTQKLQETSQQSQMEIKELKSKLEKAEHEKEKVALEHDQLINTKEEEIESLKKQLQIAQEKGSKVEELEKAKELTSRLEKVQEEKETVIQLQEEKALKQSKQIESLKQELQEKSQLSREEVLKLQKELQQAKEQLQLNSEEGKKVEKLTSLLRQLQKIVKENPINLGEQIQEEEGFDGLVGSFEQRVKELKKAREERDEIQQTLEKKEDEVHELNLLQSEGKEQIIRAGIVINKQQSELLLAKQQLSELAEKLLKAEELFKKRLQEVEKQAKEAQKKADLHHQWYLKQVDLNEQSEQRERGLTEKLKKAELEGEKKGQRIDKLEEGVLDLEEKLFQMKQQEKDHQKLIQKQQEEIQEQKSLIDQYEVEINVNVRLKTQSREQQERIKELEQQLSEASKEILCLKEENKRLRELLANHFQLDEVPTNLAETEFALQEIKKKEIISLQEYQELEQNLEKAALIGQKLLSENERLKEELFKKPLL